MQGLFSCQLPGFSLSAETEDLGEIEKYINKIRNNEFAVRNQVFKVCVLNVYIPSKCVIFTKECVSR